MRRLLSLVMLLTMLIVPTMAHASDREWASDPPKQGTAGFHLCTGHAEAGGHSYRNTNYIDDEILGNCDRYAREDVVRGFKFMYGIDLNPASVKVTLQPVR
jgi:hypothetical protein